MTKVPGCNFTRHWNGSFTACANSKSSNMRDSSARGPRMRVVKSGVDIERHPARFRMRSHDRMFNVYRGQLAVRCRHDFDLVDKPQSQYCGSDEWTATKPSRISCIVALRAPHASLCSIAS
jgi:hypothetical protein